MPKNAEIHSSRDRQVNRSKIGGQVQRKTGKFIAKSTPIAEKKEVIAIGRRNINKTTVSDADIIPISHQGSNGINASAILTDATHKPENLMTPIEKMDIVRIGVSKKDLESLKKVANLDYDKLAKALSVTRATLINKKREEKFNAVLSERIVSVADIYSYGYEVFEDIERFNQWIFRPNKALDGEIPYNLLDNQFGREEVRNIIGRIEFGVYS